MRQQYLALTLLIGVLGGCTSPWADRERPASAEELRGAWTPADGSGKQEVELLDDQTCRATEGFGDFLANCRGVKTKVSSKCGWSTKSGDTGQWLTVVLGEPKEGKHLALPMMVQKARRNGSTVLVAGCSTGDFSELMKVPRGAGGS